MKTEHRYRWRVIDRGRPWVTRVAMTEAEVRRDYPECQPEALPETLQVVEVPETAEEMLRQAEATPNPYGPSSAR